MRTVVIGFGMLVAALLLFFKISQVQVIRGDVRLELVVAAAALIFFFIGVYFNRPAVRGVGAPPPEAPAITGGEAAAKKAGLTQRELEVLQKMAEGMSNGEIAAALFLSESTIKSHVSSIFSKLDVRRRTAAIQAAKTLKILS